MNRKALLLSATYQVISFIPERKLFKLLFKNKIEVISVWDMNITWCSGTIKQPSIVKLKTYVNKQFFNSNFSRKALVKRDKNSCQYCGKKLTASQITIDHVVPRAQGGITSFDNCVVCCQLCNGKKADKTPEQAGMILLRKPTHPSFTAHYYVADPQEHWFSGWDDFLTG